MGRLIFVGIDSMDIELVHRFLPTLPNFSKLIKDGIELRSISTLPPDSITAWASIYTGKNPAEHGMVSFADPLDKIEATVVNEIDNSPIRGLTFWDELGRKGKRVCVINPHLGYPPWQVNGIMTGRSNTTRNVTAVPADALPSRLASRVRNISEIPTARSRGTKLEENEKLIGAELETVEYLMKREKWDLFFIYTSALDYVEHYFWGLCNTDDPSYPGKNPFEGSIQRFYEIYDEFIGRILQLKDDDQEIIVMSDHGHGMRPNRLINFNIILCEAGFLFLRSAKGKKKCRDFVKEFVKNTATKAVNEFGLGNIGMKFLKSFPGLRREIMTSSEIDWDSTTAYVSDQSGMKAYSYGGIIIKRERLSSEKEYEETRTRIIDLLNALRRPDSDRRIIKWCGRREELYQGINLDKYPDIIAELEEGFGFGWSAKGDLFSSSKSHNIAPGSHKRDTPVLIISKKNEITKRAGKFDISNIGEIILRMIN